MLISSRSSKHWVFLPYARLPHNYTLLSFIGLSLQSSHSVPISSPMITPWPNLHILALNDNKLGVGADIGLYLLHQVVLARTVLGHPIRTLSLSDLIIDQLRRGGRPSAQLYCCGTTLGFRF